jgi:superoxide dismutase
LPFDQDAFESKTLIVLSSSLPVDSLFWKNMAPASSDDAKLPEGTLKAQLVKDFGGVEGSSFSILSFISA